MAVVLQFVDFIYPCNANRPPDLEPEVTVIVVWCHIECYCNWLEQNHVCFHNVINAHNTANTYPYINHVIMITVKAIHS